MTGKKRAAILIGVGKSKGFPELKAVWEGVTSMELWARSAGFDQVAVVTDVALPVRARQIKDAVKSVVDSGSFDQLFIYFAGHGVNLRYSEYWLLSDALDDTQESINVESSAQLAKYAGIPHVVMFSDACRTAPEGIRAQAIQGSEMFPNRPRTGVANSVDVFYASLLGEPALEIPQSVSSVPVYVSVFTDEVVASLKGERPGLLRSNPPQSGKTFLRSHPLKAHLIEEVPRLVAQRLGLGSDYSQTPDADVRSDEVAWLQVFDVPVSKADSRDRAAAPLFPSRPVRGPGRRRQPAPPPIPALLAGLRAAPGTVSAALEKALAQDADPHLQHGISRERRASKAPTFPGDATVRTEGASVIDVQTRKDFSAVLVNPDEVAVTTGGARASNVILTLTDGALVVVPAVRDFLATLTFEDRLLRNVSYEPLPNSWRHEDYLQQHEDLQALRGAIAASAQQGVFRLPKPDAADLTEKIRMQKGVDPTMALYAAYSYQRLGKPEEVRRMERYLVNDLGFTFFDVGLIGERDDPDIAVFPFVPMLGQGWSLLRGFGRSTPQLEHLQSFVRNSLWTVFDTGARPLLLTALEQNQ